MFELQDKIATIVLILAFVLVGVFVRKVWLASDGVGSTFFTSSVTNTSVEVPLSGTSTLVLAQNSAREYALLTNRDANFVECSIGENATATQGFMLTATGGTYEINEENLFTQAIYCFADTSTSTIDVVEK